jgi:hypothetical protein
MLFAASTAGEHAAMHAAASLLQRANGACLYELVLPPTGLVMRRSPVARMSVSASR